MAPLYFIVFITIARTVFLNLYLATILDKLSSAMFKQKQLFESDFVRFKKVRMWPCTPCSDDLAVDCLHRYHCRCWPFAMLCNARCGWSLTKPRPANCRCTTFACSCGGWESRWVAPRSPRNSCHGTTRSKSRLGLFVTKLWPSLPWESGEGGGAAHTVLRRSRCFSCLLLHRGTQVHERVSEHPAGRGQRQCKVPRLAANPAGVLYQ